ncbi:cytochrome ubiquinol oxidase subunit I [Croceimicrobium hydrocarbonivorans]|uniref:Cytochrome ubiquinol oxidase subunit I n=1 Tax=Croceimicrobium hydrocarbonivorans TaxID=2761580 RepID=A0A7H0VJ74_9FLAO|nr:cytochrome ubiquinol oxidase subunit I [Croceimicrobium hydrocarbonivorans]QNR25772.1 cytochrome ubiquinol oxidase subunit I [Croceimicrobium hydrocarbonivorans]
MEVEILARLQFAFTVAFHYIYPPLSIGLGLLMVIFEALFLRTRNPQYEQLARFYTRIFGLTFGIGVATGIVMEFEFGTNWAVYSRYVGDVFGSALAAEGIFAFAMESGFLGLLLFGWNRVKPWVHFLATVMVLIGSMFSAVWIVVANSWQQTPAGFHVVGEGINARAEITDFWAMVFNPSSVDRLWHVWNGSFLAGAFLVLSISAFYLIKNKHVALSRKAFKIALVVATFFSLLQAFSGHSSANVVAEYQPAKLAALEGQYEDSDDAGIMILGWVDEEAQKTTGIEIPSLLHLMTNKEIGQDTIHGLNHFPADQRPERINAIFQFYHIMVGIGFSLIGLTLLALFFWWRGKLFEQKWLLRIFVFSVLLPQIANQFGWFSAEMGRQPWVVYGLLRTSNALSEAVTAEQVLFSIILFFVVYAFLFLLFLYLLNRKIQHGPDEAEKVEYSDAPKRTISGIIK